MLKNLVFLPLVLLVADRTDAQVDAPRQVSGVYPHLAYYNSQGECGTGAVVPWADRLWVITYSPHYPNGSDDKLYEITADLELIIRNESIGGTPANRMIHKESGQLFIGPYAIDRNRKVHTISYEEMPGRHTGTARHLFDPIHKIYYGTMEEGFYEVDVRDFQVTELYPDANVNDDFSKRDPTDVNPANAMLPGAHGKGLYSGQGVLVYANNGEATPEALGTFDIASGALMEWDGTDWKLIRRNQFVEVTGPGGIYGNTDPNTDPIWVTGWDHKSIIIGTRDATSGWSFFRLPKASHSYDGAHGWNTEWPRIRNVGDGSQQEYLMTMHGMFWHFPNNFSTNNTSGIRARSAYLKVIGDFTRWKDQLIFGCDDSAQKEFLNKRKFKGGIEGPGQSNSNLWFTSLNTPDLLGPNTASGAIWLEDQVVPETPSEPFLFDGWNDRMVWIHNHGNKSVDFTFEVDQTGRQSWQIIDSISVGANLSNHFSFAPALKAAWIRIRASTSTEVSAIFSYGDLEERDTIASPIFDGLASIGEQKLSGGLLYGLGDNRKSLGISAMHFDDGAIKKMGYYELDGELNLIPKEDDSTNIFIQKKFEISKNLVEIDDKSIIIQDDQDRRWRLPRGDRAYDEVMRNGQLRICREVATERDLFHVAGTFFELPAENADGFAKIRPIASHSFHIHDYASFRGLLVMSGTDPLASETDHIIRSADGQAAVWVGVIDDLWKLGKPRGRGGPWLKSPVKANHPSDAYLFSHYDHKTLTLSHDGAGDVTFLIEMEPLGHGPWMLFMEVTVHPGQTYTYSFPREIQARWIRFVTDRDCHATAWLEYH